MKMKSLLLGLALNALAAAGEAVEIHPPIGPWIRLEESAFSGASEFKPEDKVVFTPYFYWYDVWSNAHILNADGSDALTTHPPTLTGFSYKSMQWHKRQLEDMMDAGIDVFLPVYWGAPSERTIAGPDHWSYAGLTPLVSAREALLNEGKQPPAIGMFYDTSTLQFNATQEHVDLTTDHGKAWFYESIRDFFSLIPPKHWAMANGRPVIFLYSASFARAYDDSILTYLAARFRRDFTGRTPYVVREISWNLEAASAYQWGGALGYKNPGVASLGPGYDDSAVPGRTTIPVDREGGAFFERNWIRFLRDPSPWVFVETWNEYHEGTEIAASSEYGRQYIDLNRKYAGLFKQGFQPPWPDGPYKDEEQVRVRLGDPNDEAGLIQLEWADGKTEPAVVDDRPCRKSLATEHAARYVYFQIDDSFKWSNSMAVELKLTFWDAPGLRLQIQFDGSDPNAPFGGAYTTDETLIRSNGRSQWRTASASLSHAKFLGRQNGGGDFRVAVIAGDLFLSEAAVIRRDKPVPNEPQARLLYESPNGGTMAFKIQGEPGNRYVIESSTNLSQWTPLMSALLTVDVMEILSPSHLNSKRKFFRARTAP